MGLGLSVLGGLRLQDGTFWAVRCDDLGFSGLGYRVLVIKGPFQNLDTNSCRSFFRNMHGSPCRLFPLMEAVVVLVANPARCFMFLVAEFS